MTEPPDRDALRGKIAVVAGATRGAGRGIAMSLGEAGATVVCTGRSSVIGNARSDYDRPETIEGTARLVDELGGIGVPAVVDHLVHDEVGQLARRLAADYGHIDILVNDIWGAELLKGPPSQWNTPVWEHDLDTGLRTLRLAVETHLVTSHYLLPLLIDRPGGLLVEITDGTTAYNAENYRISVFYDLAKVAVNRLAYSQGHELAPRQGTAVAVTPGWLRSEIMLEHYGVAEGNWRDAAESAGPGWLDSETPRFVGRGIAALAADPDRSRWNQRSVTAADLARAYGCTDVDGSQPDCWK